MDDYEKMRLSDEYDDDGVEFDEEPEPQLSEKEKYFAFYDDIKQTPKDDW